MQTPQDPWSPRTCEVVPDRLRIEDGHEIASHAVAAQPVELRTLYMSLFPESLHPCSSLMQLSRVTRGHSQLGPTAALLPMLIPPSTPSHPAGGDLVATSVLQNDVAPLFADSFCQLSSNWTGNVCSGTAWQGITCDDTTQQVGGEAEHVPPTRAGCHVSSRHGVLEGGRQGWRHLRRRDAAGGWCGRARALARAGCHVSQHLARHGVLRVGRNVRRRVTAGGWYGWHVPPARSWRAVAARARTRAAGWAVI